MFWLVILLLLTFSLFAMKLFLLLCRLPPLTKLEVRALGGDCHEVGAVASLAMLKSRLVEEGGKPIPGNVRPAKLVGVIPGRPLAAAAALTMANKDAVEAEVGVMISLAESTEFSDMTAEAGESEPPEAARRLAAAAAPLNSVDIKAELALGLAAGEMTLTGLLGLPLV